jgi:hypothetical protein
VSTLVGSQWLTIDLRLGKFTPYLALFIIPMFKKRKKIENQIMGTGVTPGYVSVQNALPLKRDSLTKICYAFIGTVGKLKFFYTFFG